MEKEFKTVAKFNDQMRAEIAAGMLRANGIPAEMFNENSPFPGVNGGREGVVVRVNAEDYEDAVKLLETTSDSQTAE